MSVEKLHSSWLRVGLALFVLLLAGFAARGQVGTVFSIAPSSVTGGTGAEGTVRLPASAKASFTIQVSSNNPAAQVPATVTVPVGATTVRVPITTSPVAAATTVQIRAIAGDFQAADTLVIVPPALTSLTLSPASVLGGNSATGTVKLTGPVATSHTLRVPLAGTFTSSVTVPSEVIVASGQSSATFSVSTGPVATADNGSVTAGEGAGAKQATLIINPPVVQSITVTPTTGRVIVGGSNSNGARVEIRFTGQAPPGFRYSIEADSPLITFAPSIGTLTRSGSVEVFFPGIRPVSADTPATIKVTTGNVAKSASFTISPPSVTLLHCSGRSSIPPIVGSNPIQPCALRLNGQAPDPFSVNLTTSGPGSVPGSVKWTAGQEDSLTFAIETTPVSASTPLSITAGGKTFTGLTVLPPGVASIVLNPTSVVGGGEVTAAVTLNGDAPAGGITLPILSGNLFAAEMPPNLTFAAGQTAGSFRIGTVPVQVDTIVTVTVGVQGASKTVNLFVRKGT